MAELRTHEQLYRAPPAPELVDVPPGRFLMIDGSGDPNTSPRYAACVQALFAAAYAVKFALKKAGGPDAKVAPLEGLWWGAEAVGFERGSEGGWCWTLMIRLPDAATSDLVDHALTIAASRKPGLPIRELRVERFTEGPAAQVMHLGSYAEEGPTIATLHAFIADQGCRLSGRHHEIYLGDPRRSAPERLKTVLRQPVGSCPAPAAGGR